MFKPGDKIVCVKEDNDLFPFSIEILEIGEIYIFKRYSPLNSSQLLTENYTGILFSSENFVSLRNYRKLKLQKICLDKEIN